MCIFMYNFFFRIPYLKKKRLWNKLHSSNQKYYTKIIYLLYVKRFNDLTASNILNGD